MAERADTGHRSVPHTADVRIEAWAPTRERCVAEAVVAMVETFVDRAGTQPTATVAFRTNPGRDEDQLVAVLDEVIYRLDTEGLLPLHAEVTAADGGLDVRLRMTDAERVELVGAVPKAVALHELRFGHDAGRWSCAVTLDV